MDKLCDSFDINKIVGIKADKEGSDSDETQLTKQSPVRFHHAPIKNKQEKGIRQTPRKLESSKATDIYNNFLRKNYKDDKFLSLHKDSSSDKSRASSKNS